MKESKTEPLRKHIQEKLTQELTARKLEQAMYELVENTEKYYLIHQLIKGFKDKTDIAIGAMTINVEKNPYKGFLTFSVFKFDEPDEPYRIFRFQFIIHPHFYRSHTITWIEHSDV